MVNSGISEKLFNILYRGRGLYAITDLGFQVFNENSFSVLDASCKLLVTAPQLQTLDFYSSPDIEQDFITGNTYNALKNDKVLNKLHSSDKAFFSNQRVEGSPGILSAPWGWIFAPIRICDMLVGHISICGCNHELPEDALELADLFAHAISIEFQKNDFFIQNQGIVYETLLNDIIEKRVTGEGIIKSRLALLGKTLLPKLYVITIRDIHADTQITESALKNVSQSALRNFFSHSISLIYKHDIVLLVSLQPEQPLLDILQEDLRNFLTGNHLIAGISNCFYQISDMSEHYIQSTEAIKWGIRTDTEETIYLYNKYTAFRMFSSLKDYLPIASLCIPELFEMYISNNNQNQELLDTLFLYVKSPKSASETAKELHIHKNTLFYRINKMTEKADLDLNNGDDIFKIILTEKVIQYLKANRYT